MKLAFEQLDRYLEKPLKSIYLVSGDEPLLCQEAIEKIFEAANTQGFTEKNTFIVNTHFNWEEFHLNQNNLSLFNEKKILDVRFNKAPNQAAQSELVQYIENANPDNILVISVPKIDARSQKTKWFQALEKASVFIQLWPIPLQELPHWLIQRAKKEGLSLTPDGAKLIAEQTEGNLLASSQVITKLLLCGQTTPSIDNIKESLSTDSRYDVFTLVDAVLQNDAARFSRILLDLKTTSVEPTLIIWALTREIRQLIQLKTRMQEGASIDQAMKELFIWSTRKILLQRFLSQSKKAHLYRSLELASNTDRMIKGVETGDPWQSLLLICLCMNGNTL